MAADFSVNDFEHGGDDAEAAFRRYADLLVEFAREQLGNGLHAKIDPEDIMQSTLRSFHRRQRKGDFEFSSWESLWHLLVQIALRKCSRAERFYGANKRDQKRETSLQSAEDGSEWQRWQIDRRHLRLEDAHALQDTVHWVLSQLAPVQCEIVTLHLQGANTEEIAREVERSHRTIRRTVKLVRDEIRNLHRET